MKWLESHRGYWGWNLRDRLWRRETHDENVKLHVMWSRLEITFGSATYTEGEELS